MIKLEIYSTHVENQLRAEHNLPLRTHYAVFNGYGTPKPDESRIIRKGTTESRYFDHKSNRNPKCLVLK